MTLLGVGMLSLVVADLYFYHIRQNAIVDAETWTIRPRPHSASGSRAPFQICRRMPGLQGL